MAHKIYTYFQLNISKIEDVRDGVGEFFSPGIRKF